MTGRLISGVFMGTWLLGCATAPSAEAPAGGSDASDSYAKAPDTDAGAGSAEPSKPASNDEFQIKDSDTAASARGVNESKIKATKTETAIRFFVVDKVEEKPIPGIVVSLTAADGAKFYTEETDAQGFAEVLVPAGRDYDVAYLSLGKKDVTAKVSVKDKPNQNLKLTLRYKKRVIEKKPEETGGRRGGFVLEGITFETAKATILPESFPRLDTVLEYMTHKKSVRIVIEGHTDNVGKPASNKVLSEKRAQACKDYLVKKGIDASRIDAVGYGDEQPIASNDTPEGRQENRRIEAKEL